MQFPPIFRRNKAVFSPPQMVLNETNAALVVRERALSGRKPMHSLGRGGLCVPAAIAAVQIFPLAFSLRLIHDTPHIKHQDLSAWAEDVVYPFADAIASLLSYTTL